MDQAHTMIYQLPSSSYSDNCDESKYTRRGIEGTSLGHGSRIGDDALSTCSCNECGLESRPQSKSSTVFFQQHTSHGSIFTTTPPESPAPTATETSEYYSSQPPSPVLAGEEPMFLRSSSFSLGTECCSGTEYERIRKMSLTSGTGTQSSTSLISARSPSSLPRSWSPPLVASPAPRRSLSHACPQRRPLDVHRRIPRAITPDTTTTKPHERLYSPMAAGFARLGQKHREAVSATGSSSLSTTTTVPALETNKTAGPQLRRSSIPMSSTRSTMGVGLVLEQRRWQQHRRPQHQHQQQRLRESMALVARMFDGPA